MKKLVLTALVGSVVAASSLMAGEGFVGVDIGSATVGRTISISGTVGAGTVNVSESGDDTGGTQALKAGYYFNDNNRVYASIHRYNTSNSVDMSMYKLSYDYMIGNEPLKPFVGASISSYSYKENGLGTWLQKDSLEVKSISLGVQAGLQYKISKNIDAELSYFYTKIGESDSSTYKAFPAITAKLEGDKLSSWQFGLNYRF